MGCKVSDAALLLHSLAEKFGSVFPLRDGADSVFLVLLVRRDDDGLCADTFKRRVTFIAERVVPPQKEAHDDGETDGDITA